ncbi:hypothetical protein DFH06DRAFT_1133844 [Mycena polygramma]|nr:hypothetical protein DFH06DRAFT_1133844 [Mycena polygramma]
MRNGKFFNPYMLDDTLVIPGFHICDLVTRHDNDPQDSDSDDELSDDGEDGGGDHSRAPLNSHESPILEAARLRWAVPPGFIPSPTPPALATRPPVNLSPEEAQKLARKEKKHKLHRASRNAKREALRESAAGLKTPKAIAIVQHRQTSPLLVNFRMSSDSLPVASSGWMGLRDPPTEGFDFVPESRQYGLDEAQGIPGMTVIDLRKPTPFVDADRRIIGLYAHTPRDKAWDADVVKPAAALMEEAVDGIYGHVFSGIYYGTRKDEKRRRKGKGKATPLDEKIPRRGNHRAKTTGNSMGGGQEAPTGFFHTVLNTAVLTGLLAQKPFQRIAGFANSMFQLYAPDLHNYYNTTLNRLHCWDRRLKRNFLPTLSVFAAATFNFGPSTITLPHIDFAQPRLGLAHEKRFSFTQFTAAGIFRFVDNGFKTDRVINESFMTSAERAKRAEARASRWVEGLKMFSHWASPSS